MTPPTLSQRDLDRIADECAKRSKVPPAFWAIVAIIIVAEALIVGSALL